MSIEDCLDAEIQGLEDYIMKIKERLNSRANCNSNNMISDRKITKTRGKKLGRNHCMDISRNKLARLHSRRCGHD